MIVYGPVRKLIRLAIEEDLASGDVTSEAVVAADAMAEAEIVARQSLILCGVEVARAVFSEVDSGVLFEPCLKDGQRAAGGEVVARVSGFARSLLAAERPALNFLQRLSGVASHVACFVERLSSYSARIVDTRKTTPGWRALEKYAVRCGGGHNHRFNLGDGVLIKDNHVLAAGGVAASVRAAKAHAHHLLKVEVECQRLEEVVEAIAAGADGVLLDNMSPALVAEAVALCAGRVFTEASGGLQLDSIEAYAATGVDYLSVGSLTHSAVAADLALDFLVPAQDAG